MSDASRVAIRYDQEAVFGTTDSGSPKMQDLRFTSEGLSQDTTVVNSNEIRSDRQLSNIKRTDIRASGPINFELSYGSYDDFLAATLQSADWASAGTSPTEDVSVTASTNAFTLASGGTFLTDGFSVGEWVKTSGFTNAANNGYFKIVTASELVITVSGGSLVDEDEASSRSITAPFQIVNGTTFRSFAIEKEYTDLTNIFAMYNGMAPDGFTLNKNVGQIVNGAFEWIGTKETSDTATAGDGSPTAVSTTDVMSTVDDVKTVMEAASLETGVLAWTMNMSNNLRGRTEIGTLGIGSMGSGTIEITGTLQQYFSTSTLMDKYLEQTFSGLALRTTDSAGNTYIFDLPQIRYSGGQRVAGGQNTDVIADMQWSAILDPVEDITIRIGRWAA